jgi:hypothetical protein
MPNLHVTGREVMFYMTLSQQHDQESAAAMGACARAHGFVAAAATAGYRSVQSNPQRVNRVCQAT